MQSKKKIVLLAIVAAALILGACRTATLQNVNDAPVGVESMDQAREAIMRAGSGLGWEMDPQDEGHIEATLRVRDHMAKVDIMYDTDSYDIVYKDSENLRYDGDKIHENYNGWIQNLRRDINNEMRLM